MFRSFTETRNVRTTRNARDHLLYPRARGRPITGTRGDCRAIHDAKNLVRQKYETSLCWDVEPYILVDWFLVNHFKSVCPQEREAMLPIKPRLTLAFLGACTTPQDA